MNYEQKYKEALEKLQEALAPCEDGCKISGLTRGCLENIFLELKESEDERIRKGLIKAFGTIGKKDWGGLIVRDILAWLEKQGENKSTKNVEKKFHEGDKVVSNQDGKVYTVGTEYYIRGDNICLYGTDKTHKWANRDDLNKNYHLWTSEDAKKLDADEVIKWLEPSSYECEQLEAMFIKEDFSAI